MIYLNRMQNLIIDNILIVLLVAQCSNKLFEFNLIFSVTDGTLSIKLRGKRNDFDHIRIVNLRYISSNMPESPAYGVYISKLKR